MDDKRYTLMNKNRPVLDFLYNLDTHHVVKILKRRELDFAPPDGWWLRRAIPASRAQIQRLIAELHVDSTLALAEKNFGLSLSDVTLSRLRTPGLHRYSAPATAFGAMLNR